MKNLFVIMMLACGCTSSNGNISSVEKEYAAAVSFGSVCCGPVSDDFLKSFVSNYNKEKNVKIAADVAAGCGREGEFAVLFKLDTQNAKHAGFVTELQKLVTAVDAKNRTGNSSSGTLEVKSNVKAADLEYCRLGIKPWM